MRRAVFNQTDGVGKSSIAVNLAAVIANAGLKTRLVDLDVQGNSTHYIAGELSEPLSGVEDFFQNQLTLYLKPKHFRSLEFEALFRELESTR